MSSSSSRTTPVGLTAIGTHHVDRSVMHSTPRRNSCTASSCRRLGSCPSSRAPMTDTRDRLPVRRERTMSTGSRRHLSLALRRCALVRAGGRHGRRAQESGVRHSVYAAAVCSRGKYANSAIPV
jgi:hypothetical protein